MLLGTAVSFMALIVVIPFVNVFVQAFSHGLGPFVETLQEPDFQQVRCRRCLLHQGGGPCCLWDGGPAQRRLGCAAAVVSHVS